MKRRILIIAGIIAVTVLTLMKALAQESLATEKIVLDVKGMACPFCAYGLRQNVEKLSFLDRKVFKNGVEADTSKGTITVAVQPGKSVDLNDFIRAVIKGGYKPVAFHLSIQGVVRKNKDGYMLVEKKTANALTLLNSRGGSWDGKAYENKTVIIQGQIPVDEKEQKISGILYVSEIKTMGNADRSSTLGRRFKKS